MRTRKIFELMFHMSSLSRYSQTHLNKSESVLEHTGFVALLSLILSEGLPVNKELVLCKALCHDIDEIITGDIPRPTKYANPDITREIESLSITNMAHIVDEISEHDDIFQYWCCAKEGKEGLIVACADHIAVVYKAWMEVTLFNNLALVDHVYGLDILLKQKKAMVILEFGNETFLEKMLDDCIDICINVKCRRLK